MIDAVLTDLDRRLAADETPLSAFKETLKAWHDDMRQRFADGQSASLLVTESAAFVDGVLIRAWDQLVPAGTEACLVAVGGYGRGELHPASDVDVLILTGPEPSELAETIEPVVVFLWDIGLEIGHSVRSVSQCEVEARADISVITNLIESRPVAGQQVLFDALTEATSTEHMWSQQEFFSAKLEEQRVRHAKYGDSGQRLEPNIKESPGGLRDIQTVAWVAKRHFDVSTLDALVDRGFLTDREFRQLKDGEEHLWRVRFALHLITGRHEDRLLFEHQRQLASEFGFHEAAGNLGVERFMQAYYRTVIQMQRLNEMLLQLFREAILLVDQTREPELINRRFQVCNGYLEITNPSIFARYPLAMLEMILIMQQRPDIRGVRASTIRSVRAHRHLIDKSFQNDIRARTLFIEIFRFNQGLTHALRRMHRYGILARYLTAFDCIVGLMQFDLFHVYTVDEHILMVVRNMRRFALDKHADECPRCNEVFSRLPKPELLFLAGLFHDIAKGRGGDHSTLGARDARAFCLRHDLSPRDADLVAWLVQMHLVMSRVAQQQDIDDPDVVQEFAAMVGSITRLDYLYLLTVADVRGTNPARWNSWRASLLDRLHTLTAQAIRRGLDQPQQEDEVIGRRQRTAREALAALGYDCDQINLLWMSLSTEYFLQHDIDAIVWHTQQLWPPGKPIEGSTVVVREDKINRCSELLVYGKGRIGLFAHITALLDQLGLNVLSARVQVTDAGLSVHSYLVLEEDGTQIEGDSRLQDIKRFLEQELNGGKRPRSRVRVPRQLKHFQVESQISFEQDPGRFVTLLQLNTSDRPGLLSLVGEAFAEQQLRVRNARISTAGAEARDSFQVTDSRNQPITDPSRLEQIANAIKRRLDTDGTRTDTTETIIF